VPREFGGDELSPLELHLRYERVARASVATALILTQRDAAIGYIDANVGAPRRIKALNRLANNEQWTTVGIAQLTTSRQGGAPALRAERVDGGYRLNGVIPWCTAAGQSQTIVAGATLDDGRQILFLLRSESSGIGWDRALDMVALTQTLTSSLRLTNVLVEDAWLLRPPSPNALAGRRNGLTLGQTFIATGLCQAALDLIAKHTSDAARAAHARFAEQLETVRAEVHALCQPGREADATTANARLRGTCNDLALRVTHTAVALYKGTALLVDHPAQRFAREAMFLLVWSCPNPVIDCTVDLLSQP
jgi:alkylation response protein AidB-like acyl-CoA dehydrogenase